MDAIRTWLNRFWALLVGDAFDEPKTPEEAHERLWRQAIK